MPDWDAIVRNRLPRLSARTEEELEIAKEFATHLEDLYEHYRSHRLPETEALQRTLDAADLDNISSSLQHATSKEGNVNRRTKTLWLPGLATLTAASVSLMVLQQIVWLQPRIWWKDGGALVIHGSWFLLLPLCGAVGAYLSRRAGGSRGLSITAGIFPAIVMLGVFSVFLPIAIAIERNAYVIQHPLYFVLSMLNWTVLPAVFLILGALVVNLKTKISVGG